LHENTSNRSPSTPLSSLTYSMVNDDIGAVIVVDKGNPVGIITEKDLLEKAMLKDMNVYRTTANDIMSKLLLPLRVIAA